MGGGKACPTFNASGDGENLTFSMSSCNLTFLAFRGRAVQATMYNEALEGDIHLWDLKNGCASSVPPKAVKLHHQGSLRWLSFSFIGSPPVV